MKKQILAVSAVLGIAALVLSAGTLAYFTDKDTKTNTFTLGKVDITLKEYDHDKNPFEQDQKLMPGSSSTTAVPKEATVTLASDSENAWVWMEVLIPSALYNSKTSTNESNNALHYNQFINFLAGDKYEGKTSTNANAVKASAHWDADHQWSLLTYVDEVTIDGKTYSRLRTTHKDIMKANEESSPAISQIYLDDDVKMVEGKVYIPTGQETAGGKYTGAFAEYTGDWKVIVNAYAVQADGLANVDAAVAAYTE